MEIKAKNILITGANRGIGRAVAKLCARDEAHLHLVVRKEDPELVEEMKAAGAASCQLWLADLADRKQVENLVQQTADLKVDILFNNAGILHGGLLEEQKIEDVYQMVQVNVSSLMHITQAFLPRMLERKKGKIVNHASVAALMHAPCSSTYSATKAAVWAFTNSLRLELRGTGVTTLTLITPTVRTHMLDQVEMQIGKHFKFVSDALPPQKYAEVVREAILLDLEFLEPKGLANVALKVAKYVPKVFDFGVLKRFTR